MHTKFSWEKTEVKRRIGRPRRRWEDVRMNFRETEREDDWIHLAQHGDQWRTLVNTVMNLLVP
jgi:hypothetical protein